MKLDKLVQLDEICNNYHNVYIWGAGSFGEKVLGYLRNNGYEIKHFIDNDEKKHKTKIIGIEVIGIKDYLITKKENDIILICSTYADEIVPLILDLKITSFVVVPLSFTFHLNFVDYYNRNLHRFNNVLENIDDKSKEAFSSALKYRATGNKHFIKKSSYPQYFHPKVSPLPGDVIIDGGAFIGDTVELINNELNLNCEIHSFEPSNESFFKLQETVEKHDFHNVLVNNLGLGEKSGELKFTFSELNPAGSRISEKGNQDIRITSIDDYVIDKGLGKLDVIKLDIEGFELAALKGAKKTIEQFRPKLQVCLYHSEEDLVEIYEYLSEQFKHLNYQYYIGHHADNQWETVLYAVTK